VGEPTAADLSGPQRITGRPVMTGRYSESFRYDDPV
jgi:hypothetical protein